MKKLISCEFNMDSGCVEIIYEEPDKFFYTGGQDGWFA